MPILILVLTIAFPNIHLLPSEEERAAELCEARRAMNLTCPGEVLAPFVLPPGLKPGNVYEVESGTVLH